MFEQTTRLPVEIPVDEIAEEACQAAFAKIAEMMGECGYPVTGDFGPDEVQGLDGLFRGFVHSMALNNPVIAALNDDDAV